MSAPISDNTTAPPPAEPVLAATTPSEPVKPLESTEATTTTATTATEAPTAPEPETKKTESAPAEAAPVEKPVEKPVEAAPVEAETTQTPAITTTAATAPTEVPPKEPQEVAAPPISQPSVVSNGLKWPELSQNHPLAQFQSRLGEILKAEDHNLIWGIKLSAEEPIPFHTTLVLQKFLRANSNNVDAAYNQLLQTLKWRKEFKPEAAVEEEFSEARFGGLGYVTKINTKDGETIITYNIYGACKDPKKTFGELDSFLRWRIALMEMGVLALDLVNATVPIPDFDPASPGSAIDPYQLIQLHDYQNVSFLRMDSATKAASKKTIEVMASYYPELLSVKYFVNVPFVMSWVFTAMKAILSKETVRKFRVLSSGKGVASDLGDDVPKAYGGKGRDLVDAGLTPKLLNDVPPPPPVKEKKPSKKSSMASLEKVKEKFTDSASSPVESAESSTAPAPNVTPIPEAKEEEAAAEKASADTPGCSSAAPVPPAKDESSPVEAATPQAAVEGSTTADESVGGVTDGAVSQQPAESAPVTVEETQPEKEENTNKESLPLTPVGANETVDVEKKLDESDTTAEEAKSATEAKTLVGI